MNATTSRKLHGHPATRALLLQTVEGLNAATTDAQGRAMVSQQTAMRVARLVRMGLCGFTVCEGSRVLVFSSAAVAMLRDKGAA